MARFQFPEWTETLKKALLPLVALGPVYVVVLLLYGANAETLRVGYQPKQPVPYSHALHVGKLGLDCRYCHNTVEESPHAAVPPASTCMNCHTGIHAESKDLLPIREAYAGGDPVQWLRVHDLPDYVYFNHSAHVTRGIGCQSCHGRIDQMEKVEQVKTLTMDWCLDCHRDHLPHLRSVEEVTTMGYDPKKDAKPKRELNPRTDCSTCHR